MNVKLKIKEMIKKIDKNNLFFWCIFIVIMCVLLSNVLFVGSSLRENTEVLRIIISILAIITILYQKIRIRGEYRVFQSKLDIFIFIFIISTSMALIFKTYVSLHAELNNIFKYISAFALYIIVRDLIKYDPKYKKRILNIIILAGMGTAILGIDDLTTNFFTGIIEKSNNLVEANFENRMFGVFSYANGFAIAIAIPLILAITNYFTEEKKYIKNIYPIAIFIFMATLILSYSRTVLVLTMLFLILFLILLKEKNKRIEFVKLILLTTIAAIGYVNIFSKVQISKNYIFLWIFTLIEAIILFIVINNTKKLNLFLEKLQAKTIIIVSIILATSLGVFIFIGLKITEPLILFAEANSGSIYEYRIRRPEKNCKYKFEFDLETITELEENYEINIMEQNASESTIREDNYTIGNFNGKKEYEFETSDEAYLIVIQIINRNPQSNQSFTIRELKANGKVIPLSYKFLPIRLVDKIKEIRITDSSIYSRKMFWKDAIKLIIKNPIVGYGGEAFLYLHQSVQDIYYMSAETHSYPLQILLENGIIGILAYTCILGYYIIFIIKQKEKEIIDIGVILTLGILILHSAMDFEMTYMYIIFQFFILLSFLTSKEINKKKIKSKVINIVGTIIIITGLGINIYGNLTLEKYDPISKWPSFIEKILEEDNLLEQMLEFREEEKYYKYDSQFSMLTLLIQNELRKGDFSHIKDLYNILEEDYFLTYVSINVYKITTANEVKTLCTNLYERTKNEEYNKIVEYMKEYISRKTLQFEDLWKDHQKIKLTKQEQQELLKELKKYREEV